MLSFWMKEIAEIEGTGNKIRASGRNKRMMNGKQAQKCNFFHLLNLKYIKYRPNTSLASRSLSSSGSISKTDKQMKITQVITYI